MSSVVALPMIAAMSANEADPVFAAIENLRRERERMQKEINACWEIQDECWTKADEAARGRMGSYDKFHAENPNVGLPPREELVDRFRNLELGDCPVRAESERREFAALKWETTAAFELARTIPKTLAGAIALIEAVNQDETGSLRSDSGSVAEAAMRTLESFLKRAPASPAATLVAA